MELQYLALPCYNVATLFYSDKVEQKVAPNYLNNEKDTSMAELANMDINDGQELNANVFFQTIFVMSRS